MEPTTNAALFDSLAERDLHVLAGSFGLKEHSQTLAQAIVCREPWHEGAIWGFAQLPTAESGPNSRIS